MGRLQPRRHARASWSRSLRMTPGTSRHSRWRRPGIGGCSRASLPTPTTLAALVTLAKHRTAHRTTTSKSAGLRAPHPTACLMTLKASSPSSSPRSRASMVPGQHQTDHLPRKRLRRLYEWQPAHGWLPRRRRKSEGDRRRCPRCPERKQPMTGWAAPPSCRWPRGAAEVTWTMAAHTITGYDRVPVRG
jgi:hypothetical protein